MNIAIDCEIQVLKDVDRLQNTLADAEGKFKFMDFFRRDAEKPFGPRLP